MSNLSYLREYAVFNNTNEFNEATAEHLARINYDINATDRDVFIMLSQYAVKYNGVAHLKVSTIAKKIDKTQITIRRVLNKLVKLGVIKKESFLRKISGGNGANLLIFLSPNDKAEMIGWSDVEEVTPVSDEVDNSENEPITFISNKELKKVTYSNHRPYINNTPYNQFKDAVTMYIGTDKTDKRLISRLYGVYLAQTKQLQSAYKGTSILIEIAIKSIQVTFTATKRKKLNDIAGYFNGVISNMLDDLCAYEMTGVV